MSYLAASHAALCLGLAGAEGREVVVQQESHVALVEHVVHQFLIQFGAQCHRGEALCLAACEDGASVRHGQRAHLAPDGAYVGGLAAVQADALVEDAAAHGVAHHVVVVAVHHGLFLFLLLVGQFFVGGAVSLLEVGQYLVEGLGACLLLKSLLGHVVGGLVEFLVHLLSELLVVHLVVVLALHVGAQLGREFLLQFAHGLDSLHGGLECAQEVLFAHLFHFAFHHHDVLGRCTDHDVHVGLFHLLEGGVNHILAVDACHAHLRDWALEGDVGAGQSGRCGESGQCVGLVYAVGTEQHHVDKHLSVVVGGEQRAEHAVHETRGEDFIVAGLSFSLGESTGETASSGVHFSVVYLQGHEICSGNCIFCGTNGGQEHGVAHSEHHAAVGLFCHFPCLYADTSSVRQRDCFRNNVHLKKLLV